MYATHYTVSLNTSKVLTVVVVNKRQTGNNSPAMEPAATRASLTFLQESKVRVDTYVTDRSSSVRSLLRDEFGWIKHQECYQINFLIISDIQITLILNENYVVIDLLFSIKVIYIS